MSRCVAQKVLSNHTLDKEHPCYCDSSCSHLADCCSDYSTYCSGKLKDSSCSHLADCCSDYSTYCSGKLMWHIRSYKKYYFLL